MLAVCLIHLRECRGAANGVSFHCVNQTVNKAGESPESSYRKPPRRWLPPSAKRWASRVNISLFRWRNAV